MSTTIQTLGFTAGLTEVHGDIYHPSEEQKKTKVKGKVKKSTGKISSPKYHRFNVLHIKHVPFCHARFNSSS